VRITADTNVLVRAVLGDDARQSAAAQASLAQAEKIAITLPALCEFVWVLSQGYRIPAAAVGDAVRRLMNSANVVMNRPAVEAGLAVLSAGGDFADGIIAIEGGWLGGEVFVSFDRKAVRLVKASGLAAELLA